MKTSARCSTVYRSADIIGIWLLATLMIVCAGSRSLATCIDPAGAIDIVGAQATLHDGDIVRVPVNVRNSYKPDPANTVSALGFDVFFDPAVLDFVEFELGELLTNFTMTGCNGEFAEGVIRIGGFTVTDQIEPEDEGVLGYLVFNYISSPQCARLEFKNLVDHIEGWWAPPGYLFPEEDSGDIAEICGDGIDNNGDGLIDEGCALPDTGQTTCYDADGNVLDPCPAEDEAFYGQDAQYTINPPSYTKLNENGEALADGAAEWAMVRDNVTGLIWEVKTDDGGIHDKDRTYSWYDAHNILLAQLNADNFGNYSDWRLPTQKELYNIIDCSIYIPAVNTDYFPNTMYYYWSSTGLATDPSYAWKIRLSYGDVHSGTRIDDFYAIAVRGGTPVPSYTDNGNGTVTDNNTGLMWAQNTADVDGNNVIDDNDRMNWLEAMAWCENLELAGYDDWRLPTIKELVSIIDFTKNNPAIDTTFFPDTPTAYWECEACYLSSTTSAFEKDRAWGVNFRPGVISGRFGKTAPYNVRPVRCGLPANVPPTADAGEDREVMEGTVAALDGSGSFDPDDGIETYAWEQTGGSAVTLSDETAAQPTFTVPAGILGQTLTFALTVTDYAGASDTDSVTLTVTEFACITLPDKPLLISPSDGAVNVSLTPTLQADAYNDPGACSTHFKTRWQISDQADFSGLTYNANTFGAALTSHQVTKMVLEPATTYYWRVRYWGDHGLKSEWSDVWTFTTASDNRDANGNGVPDDQESSPNTDINDNGTPDSEETSLRALLTADGTADIGLEFGKDILAIAVEAMSETEISGDLSGDFPYGLIGFRVNTATLGATVNFTVYMADRAPDSAFWYKYDNVNGWYDFTGQVTFSANRKSLSFTLTDGGTGDADGVVNGVIVDPAGLVVETAVPSGGGSGSGCFVETVTGF